MPRWQPDVLRKVNIMANISNDRAEAERLKLLPRAEQRQIVELIRSVAAALAGPEFVTYRLFPRRRAGEVEHVRTADDWPDDPPINGR